MFILLIKNSNSIEMFKHFIQFSIQTLKISAQKIKLFRAQNIFDANKFCFIFGKFLNFNLVTYTVTKTGLCELSILKWDFLFKKIILATTLFTFL